MLRAIHFAETASPLHLARCTPSRRCPQSLDCARRFTDLVDPREHVVDGMALRNPCGSFCPIFVDWRGAAMPHETPSEAAA